MDAPREEAAPAAQRGPAASGQGGGAAGPAAATGARDWYAGGGRVRAEAEPAGFVPYYERKSLGLDRKKMAAEVGRTLEAVYARTPYPAPHTLKSLGELHRLPREAALAWFEERRAADGLPARAQPAEGQRRRQEWAFVPDGRGGGRADEPGVDPRHADLMEQLGDGGGEGPAPGGGGGGGRAEQAGAAAHRPTAMTKRELAALRSSLPSPRKPHGAKLAESLGIKAVGDESLAIGGVQFVATDGRAAWRAAWRRRRAQQPAPGRQLDYARWYAGAVEAAGSDAAA